MGKLAKTDATQAFSQFEFTNHLLNNLSQFKLSPTAKLVLLELSTYYNPKKAFVFPKQKTLADKIGVSVRTVVRAVQELVQAGLILVETKYTNRYTFTVRTGIVATENDINLSHSECQNDISKDANLSPHEKNKEEELNKQPASVDDFKILKEYAQKKGAKNTTAYIYALKNSGADKEIIKKHKQKLAADRRALKSIQETKVQNQAFEKMKELACPPPKQWFDFAKTLQ